MKVTINYISSTILTTIIYYLGGLDTAMKTLLNTWALHFFPKRVLPLVWQVRRGDLVMKLEVLYRVLRFSLFLFTSLLVLTSPRLHLPRQAISSLTAKRVPVMKQKSCFRKAIALKITHRKRISNIFCGQYL